MTTPLRLAAGFLGRLLAPAACSAVVAGGALLMPPAQVCAASEEWQFAGWSDGSFDYGLMMGGQSPITARDLRLYSDVLGLDEMQQEIMHEAFLDLDRAYNREWTLFAEARSDSQYAANAREDWAEFQKRFTGIKKGFDEKVDRMEQQFIADLRLVLNAEQLEKWARLEREQRRTKTLAKYGSYPDEKVDLVACVYALEVNDATLAELEPLLEEYRTQIDSPLVSRNRKAEQLGKESVAVNEEQMSLNMIEDPVQMQEVFQKFQEKQRALVPVGLELRQACSRVREVNRQFRRLIEEKLPADAVDEFRKLAQPKDRVAMMFGGYSRVGTMFKMLDNLEMMAASTQMQMDVWGDGESEEMANYMRRMREVQPLSEQQRSQIEQIRAEWEDRSAAIRSRYASSTTTEDEPNYIQLVTPQGTLTLHRASDDEDGMGRAMFMGMGGGSENPEQQREQSELDQRIIERIRTVLTMEQRALLAMM